MSGIFPSAGVTAPNTTGGEPNAETLTGCDALYYPARCNPRFDAIQMNFVISELVNAINLVGDYDCNRLDNLALAIQNLVNLCGLDQKGSAVLSDTIAGCFAGTNGRITIALLRDILGTCGLPVNNSPDLNDTIAMCVDGVNSQVPASALQSLIAPSIPGSASSIHPVGTITNLRFIGFAPVYDGFINNNEDCVGSALVNTRVAIGMGQSKDDVQKQVGTWRNVSGVSVAFSPAVTPGWPSPAYAADAPDGIALFHRIS